MTITAERPFQAERHVPPARRTWPAQISRISRNFSCRKRDAADINQQASQCPPKRYQPKRPVASSAASRDRAGAVDGAGAAQRGGQHHVAFDPVPRRRDGHRLAPARPLRSAWRTAVWPSPAGHRQLGGHPSPAHREPVRHPARAASTGSARVNSVAAAAKRPTPSASAASPIRASARASASAPASASARPSQPRASACQPSWRRNDPCVLCASETNRPARAAAAQFRQVAVGAAVAALPTRRNGPQPQLVWRGRRRQRPAAGLGLRTRRRPASAQSPKCDEFQSH